MVAIPHRRWSMLSATLSPENTASTSPCTQRSSSPFLNRLSSGTRCLTTEEESSVSKTMAATGPPAITPPALATTFPSTTIRSGKRACVVRSPFPKSSSRARSTKDFNLCLGRIMVQCLSAWLQSGTAALKAYPSRFGVHGLWLHFWPPPPQEPLRRMLCFSVFLPV